MNEAVVGDEVREGGRGRRYSHKAFKAMVESLDFILIKVGNH